MNKSHDKPYTAANLKLANLEYLIQNGQPVFGVFSQVKSINYLDYYSYLISQNSLPNWRKELKANQFCFIQILQPPYRVCLALATIKLATSAFVYIYNEDTQQLEVCEALQPLTHHTHLDGDGYQGQMAFTHTKLSVTLDFSPAQMNIALDSQYVAITAALARSAQPLAICTPTGRRGWTFTQKEPLTALSGHLLIKAKSKFHTDTPDVRPQKITFTDATIANLDWTLGYMRHETNWFWSCITSYLSDGRHFLLNLSMGVNETGASENACWLEGKIFYLPPVMFAREDSNIRSSQPDSLEPSIENVETDARISKPWRIYHQNLGWSNVDIDLSFTPITVYKKTDNFGVIASIFEQWIGFYNGEIRIRDEVIRLDNVMGLAEDHFAKW
ncbi:MULTISPECIES: DUF2804 domain-containing protein [Psychrobacter]|jgi:hypothetical protein|uniref:DUF2804 domain-containing protein n=1 Tax=Psychrobacter TaxID=497 RepID=UPI00086C45B7|nr:MULTISPECIES: DUF2804 domain-containing protein [Psychrobacter]MBA6245419.1 DUF2804 domain-containing protein [Psychrobacter sp. Urea-trap-18]MBA6284971.1 DUF2804 domain-containing protein [Psychrobacter sp. Urea-trap-16]MBA6318820.1 DUF2804 domain-containing protein [Psychrobacter sp. Urea-trap-20]MBA6333101.1 DUF2804 domain-containing protein [Psychrobacter sp. Urea-trap-19]OEH69119.1 MAG: hypothetical protein BAX61_02725 [Psychrobacter sp. B29-1]|tara:strand:+ start:1983 stop:3143 length:1161 start_codon:yes stop_codon:yes gene_type:complete